ncbi:sporulation protein YqfD [Clostridium sp. P21]|uniref:Sporulation protein YqfD n=1 Tax=Clostridium muellerianum TaxID=2716538 RepID=A0A7Y0EEC9_9CLOT|nr:sporulation protein YqfD [Clostridium muellerianum]NMM61944.1 sporulation protein YqfD [Clostridium muellerianum]
MSNFNFEKYKSGIITVEVRSLVPEKFINLLWENDVKIKNITKKDITTMNIDISLKDYGKLKSAAKRTRSKVKILERKGFAFFLIKVKGRSALAAGIILFIGIIYYLSTFIWNIEITVDHNLTPYEIRQQLKSCGITPGINKRNINVYEIEENLMKNNANIMWVKARVEGAKLKVSAMERQSPPNIAVDDKPCDLVAKKDGEVIRVYTKAGTSAVKRGDMIRKGQIIVKGEQGNENSTYPVHAVGSVICRTFYEETKDVKIDTLKKERTGRKDQSIYIKISGKKLYLKKSGNKFSKYDKMESSRFSIGIEDYYEVKETVIHRDPKKVVNDTYDELYSKICANLDKSVKIVDKIVNYEQGESYRVRVLVVAEENVALEQPIQ